MTVVAGDPQLGQAAGFVHQRRQREHAVTVGDEKADAAETEQGTQGVTQQGMALGRLRGTAEIMVQGRLCSLASIDAGQAIETAAAGLRRGEPVVLRKIPCLGLAFHDLTSGIGGIHAEAGKDRADVDAVHRLLPHRQQSRQLQGADQRMCHLAARQGLGLVAHGIGDPAVGVDVLEAGC